MTEWTGTRIEELASKEPYSVVGGPFGSALGRKDYVEAGVPVIRGAQLGGPGAFLMDDFVFVSEDKAKKHVGNLAYPGDIVVTQRGTVGQIGRIPEDSPYDRYLLSQSQMKLTVDLKTAVPRFVYYALRAPDAQNEMIGSTISAGVPHINLKTFRELRITVPDLRTQRSISDVLGAIDDLIENNRRRVDASEEMTRVIYREWFVHFRFPGHVGTTFVDSELGSIPDGWHVRPLFEAADVGFGFSYRSERFGMEGPFPVIRIRNVPNGTTHTFTDQVADEKYRVVDGDILIGMDGEFYVAQWSGGDAWLNQRVARLRPLDGLSPRYLMQAVEGPIRDWNSKIVGTTVAHLGKKHLEQVQVLVPDAETRVLLDETFEPHALLIRDLLQQNRRLSGIRDLLLPKLVTGQIDVSDLDLDAVVEGADV